MNAPPVAITLVCATSDAARIRPVVDELVAGGRDVQLVVGVDAEPRRVGEAIERCGEWGLIVACESRELDGPNMRKVEGIFSARRGPKHAMVRLDLSQTEEAMVAGVERAADAFGKNQGRIRRRRSTDLHLREVVPINDTSRIALPVVRLAPGEELDGDTTRIELPDNPTSAELVRRRRAAREHARERERSKSGAHLALDEDMLEGSSVGSSIEDQVDSELDQQKLERMMIIGIVGAGVIAVLAALAFGS